MSEIEEFSNQLEAIKNAITDLDETYALQDEEVNELLAQFEDLKAKLALAKNRRSESYYAKMDKISEQNRIEKQLVSAKVRERERLQKEPDVTNPPLEKIIAEMAKTPEWAKLRDYQRADLIYSWDRFLRPEVTLQWGIFNANDTSLGKTAETAMTIRGLRVLFPDAPCLWLTKQALVKTSARQCKEWGLPIVPLVGTSDIKVNTMQFIGETLREAGMAETYITNYEALNTPLWDELEKHDWMVVAVDEMHRLRGGANPGGPTKMWSALKKLLHGFDSLKVTGHKPGNSTRLWVPELGVDVNGDSVQVGEAVVAREGRPFPIFMSGSLINNGTEEIWAYIHLFNPIQFPSRQHFKKTFMTLWGEIATDILMGHLASNFFRKTKKEVGIEIHDPIPMLHEIELEKGSDLYNFQKDIVDNFMIRLSEMGDEMVSIASLLAEFHYARMSLVADKFNVSVPITDSNGWVVKDNDGRVQMKKVLRTLTAPLSKLEYAADHIFELVMGEGQNVLVFSAQFNTPIAWLKDKLESQGIKVGVITGDKRLAPLDPSDVEKQFQNNEIQVLFLNMKSGAEGLNLHKDARWPGGSSHVVLLDRWWNPQINQQAIDRSWRLGSLEPTTVHTYVVPESVDNIIDGICDDKILAAEGFTEHKALRASEWREKIAGWLKPKG